MLPPPDRVVEPDGQSLMQIGPALGGVRPPGVRPWNSDRVLSLLTNEKYIGTLANAALRLPKRLP